MYFPTPQFPPSIQLGKKQKMCVFFFLESERLCLNGRYIYRLSKKKKKRIIPLIFHPLCKVSPYLKKLSIR